MVDDKYRRGNPYRDGESCRDLGGDLQDVHGNAGRVTDRAPVGRDDGQDDKRRGPPRRPLVPPGIERIFSTANRQHRRHGQHRQRVSVLLGEVLCQMYGIAALREVAATGDPGSSKVLSGTTWTPVWLPCPQRRSRGP